MWARRARNICLASVFALALYCLFFALTAVAVHYPLAGPEVGHRGVRGAYHLHSTLSDGTGTPETIAAAAHAAGLDFIVLTDHNPTALAPARWVDGVLVVTAQELSTPWGHLGAIGTARALTQEEREQDPIGRVNALGGASFLSHPLQKKRPWTDWDAAKRAAGLELYSADSMFRTAWGRPFLLLVPALSAYAANPRHGLLTIVSPQPDVTERLLALSADTPRIALCAHDAHGRPSYQTEFRTLSMYLPEAGPGAVPKLDADASRAEQQVTRGLESGEAYCAFHALAEGGGFALGGVGPRRVVRLGESLRVQLPPERPAQTRLEVTGPAHVLADGWTVVADAPGAFQVEVWAQVPNMFVGSAWKPWLVPSPVRVEAP